MEMIKVESSNIERVGYKDGVLRVEFKSKGGSGMAYDYHKVPVEAYNDLILCESKGRFFAAHIKKFFDSQKVSNAEIILEKAQELVEDSRLRWKDLDKKRRLLHLDQIINLCMSAAECENKVDSKE